jgi:hypothetical protein
VVADRSGGDRAELTERLVVVVVAELVHLVVACGWTLSSRSCCGGRR